MDTKKSSRKTLRGQKECVICEGSVTQLTAFFFLSEINAREEVAQHV